jgi:hypothetical protein
MRRIFEKTSGAIFFGIPHLRADMLLLFPAVFVRIRA